MNVKTLAGSERELFVWINGNMEILGCNKLCFLH